MGSTTVEFYEHITLLVVGKIKSDGLLYKRHMVSDDCLYASASCEKSSTDQAEKSKALYEWQKETDSLAGRVTPARVAAYLPAPHNV